jgi:hypothetical protein
MVRAAGTATLLAGLLLASVAQAAGGAPPRVTRQGDRVRIGNSHYRIDLDVGDGKGDGRGEGLGWAGIANLDVPANAGQSVLRPVGSARLFEVAIHVPGQAEPVRLDSRQFTVREVRLDPAGGVCELQLRAGGAATSWTWC